MRIFPGILATLLSCAVHGSVYKALWSVLISAVLPRTVDPASNGQDSARWHAVIRGVRTVADSVLDDSDAGAAAPFDGYRRVGRRRRRRRRDINCGEL